MIWPDRPASSTAIRWKSTERASAFGALTRQRASLQYQCGAKAANDLDAFIARRPVSCIPISHDRYGRTVASCSVAGADLAEWLVGNGLALDLPQYSKGKIDTIQREDEHARRSMLGGRYG